MAVKVGINGFGRIGRLVFRAAVNNPNIEIVGINDLITPDYMAYMLKYDTIHGRFEGTVDYTENSLIVNGKSIRVTAEKDPANLRWNEVAARPPSCLWPNESTAASCEAYSAISLPSRSWMPSDTAMMHLPRLR